MDLLQREHGNRMLPLGLPEVRAVRVDNLQLHKIARPGLYLLLFYFAVTAVAKPLLRPYNYSDFATFYSAAEAFRDGTTPYELSALQKTGGDDFQGWIGRYLYPPPFAAVAIRPLLVLPFPVASRLWVGIEAAAFVLALLLLTSIVFGDHRRSALLLTGLVGLTWAPFQLDLRLGSVSGILLLLLMLFLYNLKAQRRRLAGIFLGLAALLKVSPILLVLLLVLRRQSSTAVAAIATALGTAVVCLPATGWQAWLDYVQQVVPVLSNGNFSWFTNQSIDAFFWRLFMPNPDTTPWLELPWLYHTATVTASLLTLAAVGLLAWRQRHSRRQDDLLWLMCLGLLAALMVARVTWEYMTVLAIPCFVLWVRELVTTRRPRPEIVGMLLAWILCAAPLPYTQEPFRAGIGLLFESPRLYGMGLALLILVRLHLRRYPKALDAAASSVVAP